MSISGRGGKRPGAGRKLRSPDGPCHYIGGRVTPETKAWFDAERDATRKSYGVIIDALVAAYQNITRQ